MASDRAMQRYKYDRYDNFKALTPQRIFKNEVIKKFGEKPNGVNCRVCAVRIEPKITCDGWVFDFHSHDTSRF